MSAARRGTRLRRAATASAVVALVFGAAGCGRLSGGDGDASDRVVTVDVAGTTESGSTPDEDEGAPATGKEQQPDAEPSLPPGDPGLDAPSVPEPAPEGEAHEDRPARRTVPAAAMLTADTVRMVLGGGWESHAGGGDECLRPASALGVRSTSYGGTDAGMVVETVATYRDAAAADAAVAELGRAAAGCGWTGEGDPRLGSASVTASRAGRAMTAVSSEGVVVLLVGTGAVTRNAVRWGSLVDLALGTSCPAAPDGCH